MSEVQTRQPASRGRVSARGGRGGYSNRGGRGGNRSSKPDSSEASASAFEDEGEIGQMKKKYASSLPTLKELFPDWTDEDLVFALEDANGDLESAIEHITEGNVSQWGEVKKKTTDRSRTKPKDAQSGPTDTISASVRGGRGRGGFEGRGRARGDRGGRGGRGGRAGFTTNETRPATTTAVTTSTATADAWDIAATDATTATAKPEMQPEAETAVATGDSNEGLKDTLDDISKTSAAPEPPKKGWASLFAKPAPPPPQKKAPAPSAAPVSAPEVPEHPVEQKHPEPVPVPLAAVPLPTEPVSEQPAARAGEQIPSIESVIPPKDDLTKTNLEQIPDESAPAPTATVASTIGSTHDIATATPSKPIVPGYPPSAFKQSARGPSFQRRVLEQQEAVVMPGNHALDRATVQFGSMGLNGDAADLDIDENREDAETRAQPPQHSPAAPRAALPPASQAHLPAEGPAVARPAPGLPPVPQASGADSSFTDFSRYTDAQKPFDPFSHQVSQPQPLAQEPFANQAPTQPAGTSASDYSPFYAADQQRLPYNYYGATYGQSQDATAAQRAASGFGGSGAEAQQQVPTTQPPSRYGHVEASNSGHNTPNPTLPAATQTPSAQHVPAGGQGAHAGYGYGYPYYSNPHYASYMNQMNQQHQYGRNRPMYDDARRYDEQQQQQQQHYMPHSNQYGYANQYGAPYGGKGGMYGQPQHGFSYEHSSSPANAGSFNQSVPGRDSVYGRSGSAQPSEAQQVPAGAGAFGTGMSDVFGRSQGGFGQNQPMGQQQPVAAEETPKSYETPKAGGPSPSLASANRPGSATNSGPGQAQGQPPLQGQQGQQGQQGFGGYPHLNPQYGGGLGGLGGHQGGGSSHQGSGYGNYGGAGFGNYYGNSGRGGWGGNYGH